MSNTNEISDNDDDDNTSSPRVLEKDDIFHIFCVEDCVVYIKPMPPEVQQNVEKLKDWLLMNSTPGYGMVKLQSLIKSNILVALISFYDKSCDEIFTNLISHWVPDHPEILYTSDFEKIVDKEQFVCKCCIYSGSKLKSSQILQMLGNQDNVHYMVETIPSKDLFLEKNYKKSFPKQ